MRSGRRARLAPPTQGRHRGRARRGRTRGSSRASTSRWRSPLSAVRRRLLSTSEPSPSTTSTPGQRVDADAHRFDVLDLRRREDREDLEQRSFVVSQQLIAPGDRVAQRPLPVGQVAGPAAEDIESATQAIAKLGGREQPKPRGRELDRERQPVEPRADLADDGSRFVIESEARPRLTAALHEERDGRGAHRSRRTGRQ